MTITVLLLVAALVATTVALVVSRRAQARTLSRLVRHLDVDDGLPGLGQRVESRLVERLAEDRAALYEIRTRCRLLEQTLDSMTQGAVVVDATGEVTFINRFASAFVRGRHSDAVVETHLTELVASAREGNPDQRELALFGPPRRALLLHALPLPPVDDAGSVGAIVLVDDVTEHQRLDAIRRDFVANIGHELKTPIGAISLLAETLEGETDIDVVRRLGERISREVLRLGRTVQDLLEFSRIEHDDQFDRKHVVLQEALEEAVDRHRVSAQDSGVDISLTRPANPIELWADRRQLVSAVSNLVDNAIKYTDPGATITVRGRRTDDTVDIEVRDTGRGIPRRDLDRIFERFYRVDTSRGRQSGGVGLGLAIVRHVATNHGGTVSVSSIEGEGSVFTMTLPAAFDPHDGNEPDLPVPDALDAPREDTPS